MPQRGGSRSRAARVRRAPEREPGGDGDARSARRAAGEVAGAPGVGRVAVMRIVARWTEGQLRHVELAQRDRARRAQAAHRRRVVLGDEVLGRLVPHEVSRPRIWQRSCRPAARRAAPAPAARRRVGVEGRAEASASASTVMKARSRPSRRPMRSRHSVVTSTAEALRSRSPRPRPSMVSPSCPGLPVAVLKRHDNRAGSSSSPKSAAPPARSAAANRGQRDLFHQLTMAAHS